MIFAIVPVLGDRFSKSLLFDLQNCKASCRPIRYKATCDQNRFLWVARIRVSTTSIEFFTVLVQYLSVLFSSFNDLSAVLDILDVFHVWGLVTHAFMVLFLLFCTVSLRHSTALQIQKLRNNDVNNIVKISQLTALGSSEAGDVCGNYWNARYGGDILQTIGSARSDLNTGEWSNPNLELIVPIGLFSVQLSEAYTKATKLVKHFINTHI